MHLGNLTISRFRSCEKLTLELQPDLTVLVGENNGGKSNIIDALRLLTLPLSGRRDRYPEDDDLRRGSTTQNFECVGHYFGLSDMLKGLLISAVPDPNRAEAIFGYRYEPRSKQFPRGYTTQWAGKFEAAEPEGGSSDLIRHVYLPPLREAHQALGSSSGTRVMALLRQFLPKDQEEAFLGEVRRAPNAPPQVLMTMTTEIGTALGDLTKGVREQSAQIDFNQETLLDVARDMRFKLADAGIKPEDIRASGLGYSNLLYMATVVVELAKAKEADLTLFLVEEPEAHLHPQLQALVLEFLLEQATKSSTQPVVAGQPEGRIQVIVTTHSPNLTAWVSAKHLVVVRSRSRVINAVTLKDSLAVPIAKLPIRPKTLEKIDRYLDVTRSAMLFGSRVVLVEGIAEALLLPVIAKKHVLNNNRDGWLRFKSTLIVPVDGVDFRPYVEVLLRPHSDARIADKVIVITDADPSVDGNRKDDLEALATECGARASIGIHVNVHTLEHELMLAGNEALLKKAFLEIHPRSTDDWRDRIEAVAADARPAALIALMEAKRTRKGDFAQAICQCIEDGDAFVVPNYLRNAITGASAA